MADENKCRKPSTFSAASVAEMLRRCGAPEPWARPDLCAVLAELMTSASSLLADNPTFRSNLRPHTEAWKAARRLQKLLPVLALRELDYLESPPLLGGPVATDESKLQHERTQRFLTMCQLLQLLKLIFPRSPVPPKRIADIVFGWHFHASLLFGGYRRLVGSGSPTKNGPAVRFVAMALCAVGHRASSGQSISYGAVEAVLREDQKQGVAKSGHDQLPPRV
jgi:hypothetical protein